MQFCNKESEWDLQQKMSVSLNLHLIHRHYKSHHYVISIFIIILVFTCIVQMRTTTNVYHYLLYFSLILHYYVGLCNIPLSSGDSHFHYVSSFLKFENKVHIPYIYFKNIEYYTTRIDAITFIFIRFQIKKVTQQASSKCINKCIIKLN